MFHKAVKLDLLGGTLLELTFQDGKVKQYDMAVLFDKYPQLSALKERSLFMKGRLLGFYGIIWNDKLDVEAETIYEEGRTVRTVRPAANIMVGNAVLAARAEKGLSQAELARSSGIDQSDISKIERGFANPSVNTLARIAEALSAELHISIS